MATPTQVLLLTSRNRTGVAIRWSAGLSAGVASLIESGRVTLPAMAEPTDRTVLVSHARWTGERPEISIVVPAYNEAFRLPALLSSLQQHCDAATTQIIVVDDGSTDATVEVAEQAGEWAPHLQVISHSTNQGKGAAVRTGVRAAAAPVVGFVDADNATDLAALAPMVDALDANVAAVFGSRHADGSSVTGSPKLRGMMGRVFNHIVKLSAGTAIRDTQCGAKLFQGPVARLAFALVHTNGFAFDVEVLRLLLTMGFDVHEFPVKWHYVHGTKIKLATPFRMLVDIAKVRARSGWSDMPAIDTNWSEAVAGLADPLWAGTELRPGDPCTILCPGIDAGEVRQTADRLRQAGLWADVTTRSLTDVRNSN